MKNNTCEDREFAHSGDLGDIVFSLATIRACGGADTLYLCNTPGKTSNAMDQRRFDLIAPLVDRQPYVGRVAWSPHAITSNLDGFRSHMGRGCLIRAHAGTMGLPSESVMFSPWLECDKRYEADVVIARTPRYRSKNFPWAELYKYLKHELRLSVVFLGLKDEHADFEREVSDTVRYLETRNLLEAAEIINGASLFCGLQTSLHAVADGLGKPIVLERARYHHTCDTWRDNTLSVAEDETFNKQWITEALTGKLSYLPKRVRTMTHPVMPDLGFYVGGYEQHKRIVEELLIDNPYATDLLKTTLPKVSRILDIGGYIGVSSRIFQHLWPDARIITVEPNVKWHEMIHLNAPYSHAVYAAVSETPYPGYVEFARNEGSNYTTPVSEVYTHGIYSVTFKSLVAMYGTPDILKIDCEGAEHDIVAQIKNYPIKAVVGEYHRCSPPEFLGRLEEAGYSVVRHQPLYEGQGTFVAFNRALELTNSATPPQ